MRFVERIKLPVKYGLVCVVFMAIQPVLAQQKIITRQSDQLISLSNEKMKVEVDPHTFAVTTIDGKGNHYVVSAPAAKQTVRNLKQDKTSLSWTFGEGLTALLELHDNWFDVTVKSADTAHLIWPKAEAKISAFTIPLHQGKYIPAQDERWKAHFAKNPSVSGSQDLSMQFFATNFEDKALVYVIKNMFNNELEFYTHEGLLAMQFKHEFPVTVKDKQFGFRIYLVNNNPVAIAKTYQKYVEEKAPILTLEDKAKDNAAIRKLYGAPHIYIWNNEFLVSDDVKNWKLLKDKIIKESASATMNPTKHIFELFLRKSRAGKEFCTIQGV